MLHSELTFLQRFAPMKPLQPSLRSVLRALCAILVTVSWHISFATQDQDLPELEDASLAVSGSATIRRVLHAEFELYTVTTFPNRTIAPRSKEAGTIAVDSLTIVPDLRVEFQDIVDDSRITSLNPNRRQGDLTTSQVFYFVVKNPDGRAHAYNCLFQADSIRTPKEPCHAQAYEPNECGLVNTTQMSHSRRNRTEAFLFTEAQAIRSSWWEDLTSFLQRNAANILALFCMLLTVGIQLINRPKRNGVAYR